MRDHSLRSSGFGFASIVAIMVLLCSVAAHAQDVNPEPLLNVRWVLTQLGSTELPRHKGTREPSMTLTSPPGRLEAFSGCNRMFGAITVEGAKLRFGPGIGMTRMACAGRGSAELESAFAQALQATARWRIDGTALELLDEPGAVLARFTARSAR